MLDGRGFLIQDGGVEVAAFLLAWTVVLVRIPGREASAAGRDVWTALLLLACAITVDTTPLGGWLDRLLPGHAVAGGLVAAIGVLAIGTGAIALVRWADPDEAGGRAAPLLRRLMLLTAAADAVALVRLPASVTTVDVPDARIMLALWSTPEALPALVLVPAFVLACVYAGVRPCLRLLRVGAAHEVAVALRWLVAGCVLLLGWLLCRAAALLGAAAGAARDTVTVAVAMSDWAFQLAALCFVLAFLAPGRLGTLVRDTHRHRRDLLTLRPLWGRAVAARPEIVLQPAGWWRDACDPRDLRVRVYRRVIEIRDAVVLLQPHLRADRYAAALELLRDRCGDLDPIDLHLLADAVELELAGRDAAAGIPPAVAPGDHAPHAGTGGGIGFGPLVHGAGDLDAELVALARVARRDELVLDTARALATRSTGA